MENFQVPGVNCQIRILGNPGRQMTPLRNNMPAYIGRRENDEQPALAEHRNDEEGIIYGRTRP
jgi:hypothetical protein